MADGAMFKRSALLAAGALLITAVMAAAGAMSVRAWAAAEPLRIVAFGDSLTSGYGLPADQSFPAQLERALKARGHNVEIANAGVSGDTTAAGLARFDWAIPPNADAVILELGANDALRGIAPKTARANLDAILQRLKSRGIPVLIAGFRAPANWGRAYAASFDKLFGDLARKYGHDLYPFFLEGVAMQRGLNQPDGLHPNAAGVARIVEQIAPSVERLIARARSK